MLDGSGRFPESYSKILVSSIKFNINDEKINNAHGLPLSGFVRFKWIADRNSSIKSTAIVGICPQDNKKKLLKIFPLSALFLNRSTFSLGAFTKLHRHLSSYMT